MFTGEIAMLQERQGNRKESSINLEKSNSLGWKAKEDLKNYIENIVNSKK